MKNNQSKFKGLALIPLMLLALLVGQAHAQNFKNPDFHWGIKGGPIVTTMVGDQIHHPDVRVGFSGGVFLNYRFTGNWSLQPEILFSMKGVRVNPGVTGDNGSANYEIGYLEVPVLVRYTFETNSIVEPYLNVGPQVGFTIYGSRDISKDLLKDVEFALAFGGGVNFDVASSPADVIKTLGLDLRYTLGLTNAFDIPGEPEARNEAFIGGITIGF